jgi:lipooligosaccharide transport system ATP-binding protein
MMAVVIGTDVCKRFGDLQAVDRINFSIEPAECFGFLGPNGAGKTTAMKMIYCRLMVGGGDILVNGISVKKEPRKIKSMIGVATQEDDLDRDLTTFENLKVYSRYFDIPWTIAHKRIDELLAYFDLDKKRDTPVDDLSGGMRRRLTVARALVNDPKLLILDEPTTGLDPQARRQIWDTVIKLRSEGKTIILTTHYMDEAQELCDRIALMFGGKILEYGSPREVIDRAVGKHVCELYTANEEQASGVKTSTAENIEQIGNRMFIYGNDGEALREKCESMTGLRQNVRPATLEDVFLKFTGKGLK